MSWSPRNVQYSPSNRSGLNRFASGNPHRFRTLIGDVYGVIAWTDTSSLVTSYRVARPFSPAWMPRNWLNMPLDCAPRCIPSRAYAATDYACDPEDLLFEPGTKIKAVEVVHIRPPLTEEIIPSLQPRESEYTVWDHEIPGLGLRIRASGHKSFILLYRIQAHSKLKKITIGKAGCFTLKRARQLAEELLSDERLNRLRVKISRQYRPLWDEDDEQ